MNPAKPLVCAWLCTGAVLAAPVQTALLSVGTEEATLYLARPESQRPVAAVLPLPYSEDFILKLEGLAQSRALATNERVATENARALEIAAQTDRDERERRHTLAEYTLSQSDLGKAVLKAPIWFDVALTNGLDLVALSPDADGYVSAADDARLVRILFGDVRFQPQPSPVPNTSNEPVKATLPVTVKIENPAGERLSLESFEETMRFPNDALLGPARAKSLETLVKAAVAKAATKIHVQPTTAVSK